MTLPESEAVLRLCGTGTFLVRQSGSRRGELSISTRGDDSVCHFKIRYGNFRRGVWVISRVNLGPMPPRKPHVPSCWWCPHRLDVDCCLQPDLLLDDFRYINLHYSITDFRSFATLQELVHFYQELHIEFKRPFSLESPGMACQSEEVERWPQQPRRWPHQPLRGREQPAQPAQPRNTFNNRSFVGHDHASNPRSVGMPGGRHGDRAALLGGGLNCDAWDASFAEVVRKRGLGRNQGGGGSHLKWALNDSRAMQCNCRVTLVAALLLILLMGAAIYMTIIYVR